MSNNGNGAIGCVLFLFILVILGTFAILMFGWANSIVERL